MAKAWVFMAALVVTVAVAAAQGKGPKPMFPTWQSSIVDGAVPPTIDGDFVAVVVNNGNTSVASLDSATGEFLWTSTVNLSTTVVTFVCNKAAPELVFVVSAGIGNADGKYTALNRSTGTEVWSLPMNVSQMDYTNRACPTSKRGSLLIMTQNTIYGVDPLQGTLRFQHQDNTMPPFGIDSPFELARCGDDGSWTCAVYIASNGSDVVVLNAISGNQVARFPSPALTVDFTTEDLIIMSGDRNFTVAVRWDGTPVWSVNASLNNAYGDYWLSMGYYSIDTAPNLVSYSIRTGQELWRVPDLCEAINAGPTCTPFVTVGNALPLIWTECSGALQPELCVGAAIDPATGKIRWLVVNQTMVANAYTNSAYALFSNNTYGLVVRIDNGEERSFAVPENQGAQYIGSTPNGIIVSNFVSLMGFKNFGNPVHRPEEQK